MTHQASFLLSMDPAVARHVAAALAPEALDAPEGATVACRPVGEGLEIEMTAPTVGALRAACQGTIRLADAALRVAAGRP